MRRNKVLCITQTGHLILVVGDIGIHVPAQIFFVDQHDAYFQFHTLVRDGAHVAQHGVEACHLFYRYIEQQVAGLLVVAVEGHRQAVLEETCAQTDIIRGGGLPLQVGVRLVGNDITRGTLSVDDDRTGGDVGSKLVVADLLITDHTHGGTQLDEVYLFAQVQPFLTVDVPRGTQ